MVYRRRIDGRDSEWHFRSDCPNWPELGSVKIRFLRPDQDDRICAECSKEEYSTSGIRFKRNNDYPIGR